MFCYVNSSLVTVTLYSSVTAAFVYDTKHLVCFVTLQQSLTVLCIGNTLLNVVLFEKTLYITVFILLLTLGIK